jgi:hypothetical protein
MNDVALNNLQAHLFCSVGRLEEARAGWLQHKVHKTLYVWERVRAPHRSDS